jgi:hypothetical protein
MNPGAIIAASLAGSQSIDPRRHMMNAQEPFVWGQGGQRMTPDAIARQREIAQSLAQSDYSPVGSVWEGLGRVVDNVNGALQNRKLDKAERANMAYSQNQIAQLLTGGGTPSASAPPGSPQSSAPGGDTALAMQIISDPYADAGAKAIAQMQIKQAQAMQMKQFEYANREQPEIVQLANIANDQTQPDWRRKAAADRVTALNDPIQVIPGINGGTYVGRASGIADALGGTSAPDTLPPDFFDGDGPPPASAAPPVASVLPPESYRALVESLGGEAEAKAFMRRNGLTVGGR